MVNNRDWVVHPDHTAGLPLYGLRSFPGLIDELCWHSRELGQIFSDVDTPGVYFSPVIITFMFNGQVTVKLEASPSLLQ